MDALPRHVLLDVLALLPPRSVLALRRTSKSLRAATHTRALWALLFRTHVLDPGIPYPDPGVPLADLSAAAIESLTRRALSLRSTWSSPSPVPRRRLAFTACTDPGAHIIFLQFLPGRSNRWLISVCATLSPRTYLLQCWDVVPERPRCVAELRHADGPYNGVVLNTDPSSPAVLAMQSAQTETFSIRFDAEDPECAFVTEATIDGIRELYLLSGSTLVTRSTDGSRALCLWNLDDLGREKVRLLNPSLPQLDDRVQAVHLARDYAIVVRTQSIEIYSTTPRPNLLPVRGAPIAYPLTQFKFQRRTDTVVLCEQHESPQSLSDPRPRPIHLFARFGSIYPWPLHHYVLLPNPAYRTGGRAYANGSGHHQRSPPSPCTTEYNLPYDPRPRLTHIIGSPVRLLGQFAMALGRYGTALWLDNNTEEWSVPNERGQRLAGRVMQFGLGGSGDGDRHGPATPAAVATSTNASSSDGLTVFGVRDDDAWTHIAMEEEAGRIAVGHANGAITLLEY